MSLAVGMIRNPDIAEAVREGRAKSGRDHFVNNGYFEGVRFDVVGNMLTPR